MKFGLLLSGLFLLFSEPTWASSQCNPDIKPVAADELAYRDRGDRCEGLFVQKVSATGLRVAAFHKSAATFDENALALNINVSGHSGNKQLSVTSLRPNQYYRMDASFEQDNFSLPLELLRHPQIDIKPQELATIICVKDCQSAVPTLVAASFADEDNANPYVALVANLEIFELRVTIRDEETGEVLHDKEMLGSRTWPAGRPATFPLKPYFKGRNEVRMEIVAAGRGNELIDSVSMRLQSR
ncbi:hypothetical protein DKP76_18250 [Falsochrobactrum shanghaiense]|uniref:Uncharacterized protein n=1 Tax=Falsochrobactrum shanghaiense TaxID=2201899 RepID=A0A316J564_9HYPH|nr:hypothetical protein [Falsochrobactrum shanghaiense]PWL16308.1 hypothetical protein DKP76_18250 [Falsochrobactrum shanghaiense]